MKTDIDAAAVEAEAPASRIRLALLAIYCSVVLSTLSMTSVSVALPSMGLELGLAPSHSVWLIIAFQLTVLATLLPFGSLGEQWGFRKVFLIGLGLIALASIVCMVSRTFELLLIGRIAQGVGAAAVASMNPALLRMTVDPSDFGRVVGTNAVVVAITSAIGPSVAAFALSLGGWQWLFALNLPLAAAAAYLGWMMLPRVRGATASFDGVGALLIVATLTFFALGYEGSTRQGVAALAFVVLGVGLATALVLHQRARTNPMLPLDLLRIRVFRMCIGVSIFAFAAQMASLVALPFVLSFGLGLDVVYVGILMMATPAAIAVMAPVAARAERHFSSAGLSFAGGLVMAASLAVLSWLPSHTNVLAHVAAMLLCGVGFGLIQTPNNRSMLTSVPRIRSGGAGAMQATSRLIGHVLGAAAVGAMFRVFPDQVTTAALASLLVAAGFAALSAAFSLVRRQHRD